MGYPSGSAVKSACQRGRWRLGRSPAGGHGSHPSILGWRLPRTEEPGGPQSLGSQSRTGLSLGAGRWSDWRGLRAECERWGGRLPHRGSFTCSPPAPPCRSVPTRPGTSTHLRPGVWGPLFSNQLKKKEEKFYLQRTWEIPTTPNSEE